MNQLRLLLPTIALALSACATAIAPEESYPRLLAVPQQEIAPSLSEAVRKKPVPTITQGKAEVFRLDQGDGILQVGPTRTYYRVFRFAPAQREVRQLEVRSFCDCIGFTKTIVIPKVVLLDSAHKPIAELRGQYKTVQAGSMGSYHILATYDLPSTNEPTDSTVDQLILLHADNANPGKRLTGIGGDGIAMLAGALLGAQLVAAPAGDFRLTLLPAK